MITEWPRLTNQSTTPGLWGMPWMWCAACRFLTVASMDRDLAIESYTIRVRCVSPSDEQQAGPGGEAAGLGANGTVASSGGGAVGVPCPEPELQSGPCSGRGTCVMPPQVSPIPVTQ